MKWLLKYKDREILIIKNETEFQSWYCGYAIVTKNQPLFEKDYNDSDFPDFDVHGGVTFTGRFNDLQTEIWHIGFDCNHFII